MRGRSTEQGHDGVADELLDRSAVAFELRADARVVGIENSANVFRIETLRQPGESDEVDEEDADDFALDGSTRLFQLGAAGRAVGDFCRQWACAARGAQALQHPATAAAKGRVPRVEEAASRAASAHRPPLFDAFDPSTVRARIRSRRIGTTRRARRRPYSPRAAPAADLHLSRAR